MAGLSVDVEVMALLLMQAYEVASHRADQGTGLEKRPKKRSKGSAEKGDKEGELLQMSRMDGALRRQQAPIRSEVSVGGERVQVDSLEESLDHETANERAESSKIRGNSYHKPRLQTPDKASQTKSNMITAVRQPHGNIAAKSAKSAFSRQEREIVKSAKSAFSRQEREIEPSVKPVRGSTPEVADTEASATPRANICYIGGDSETNSRSNVLGATPKKIASRRGSAFKIAGSSTLLHAKQTAKEAKEPKNTIILLPEDLNSSALYHPEETEILFSATTGSDIFADANLTFTGADEESLPFSTLATANKQATTTQAVKDTPAHSLCRARIQSISKTWRTSAKSSKDEGKEKGEEDSVITQAAALDADADEANHREKNKGKARGKEERLQRKDKEKEVKAERGKLKAEEMEHEEKKKNAEAERKKEVLEKQKKEKERARLQKELEFANSKKEKEKRDSSLKIDMKKGPGTHEVVEEAKAKEVETCETPQNEERLQEADERPYHASHSARRSGGCAPQPEVILSRLKEGGKKELKTADDFAFGIGDENATALGKCSADKASSQKENNQAIEKHAHLHKMAFSSTEHEDGAADPTRDFLKPLRIAAVSSLEDESHKLDSAENFRRGTQQPREQCDSLGTMAALHKHAYAGPERAMLNTQVGHEDIIFSPSGGITSATSSMPASAVSPVSPAFSFAGSSELTPIVEGQSQEFSTTRSKASTMRRVTFCQNPTEILYELSSSAIGETEGREVPGEGFKGAQGRGEKRSAVFNFEEKVKVQEVPIMHFNFGISLGEDDDSKDSLKAQDAEDLLYGEIQRRAKGEAGNFEKEESELKTELEKEIELLPEAGKQKSGAAEVKADDEEVEEEGKASAVEGAGVVEMDDDETRDEAENGGGRALVFDFRLYKPSPEPAQSMSDSISGQSENTKDEMDDGDEEMKEALHRPVVSGETDAAAKISKRLRSASSASLSAMEEIKEEEREESAQKTELEKEIALLPEAGMQKSSDVAGVREEGTATEPTEAGQGPPEDQKCCVVANHEDWFKGRPDIVVPVDNLAAEDINQIEVLEQGNTGVQGNLEEEAKADTSIHKVEKESEVEENLHDQNEAARNFNRMSAAAAAWKPVAKTALWSFGAGPRSENVKVEGNCFEKFKEPGGEEAEDEAKGEVGTADESSSFNQGHASKDRESAELKDLSVSFCGKKRKWDFNEDPKTRSSIASDMADENKSASPFFLSAKCSGDDAIKDKASVTDDAELGFDAKKEVGATPEDGKMVVPVGGKLSPIEDGKQKSNGSSMTESRSKDCMDIDVEASSFSSTALTSVAVLATTSDASSPAKSVDTGREESALDGGGGTWDASMQAEQELEGVPMAVQVGERKEDAGKSAAAGDAVRRRSASGSCSTGMEDRTDANQDLIVLEEMKLEVEKECEEEQKEEEEKEKEIKEKAKEGDIESAEVGHGERLVEVHVWVAEELETELGKEKVMFEGEQKEEENAEQHEEEETKENIEYAETSGGDGDGVDHAGRYGVYSQSEDSHEGEGDTVVEVKDHNDKASYDAVESFMSEMRSEKVQEEQVSSSLPFTSLRVEEKNGCSPCPPAPKCHAESHPETSSYPSCPGADQAKALEEQCKEMKVEKTEESERKTELEKEIELLPEAGKQESSAEVKAGDEEMEEEGKASAVEGAGVVGIDDATGDEAENGGGGAAVLASSSSSESSESEDESEDSSGGEKESGEEEDEDDDEDDDDYVPDCEGWETKSMDSVSICESDGEDKLHVFLPPIDPDVLSGEKPVDHDDEERKFKRMKQDPEYLADLRRKMLNLERNAEHAVLVHEHLSEEDRGMQERKDDTEPTSASWFGRMLRPFVVRR